MSNFQISFLALIICVISRPQLEIIEKALNNENITILNSSNEIDASTNLQNQWNTNLTAEDNEENYKIYCYDENGNKIDKPETNNSCAPSAVLYISTIAIASLQGP